MTVAGSQTSGTSLALVVAVAGIGAAFFVTREPQRPPVASSATERQLGEPFETDLEFTREPPPPKPPPEDGVAEVEPRAVGWLTSLPRHRTFRAQSFAASRAPDGEPLGLRWTVEDRGLARDADGGLVEDGDHDVRYTLAVTWNGETRTVTLEPGAGYPDAAQISYCDRRGWCYVEESVPMRAVSPYAPASAHLPELGVFAEGNFRGDEVYRVLATPHAIQVIAQDTSPADWIHDCRKVHQGPFAECFEMRWFLLATIAVDLPSEVRVSETVSVVEEGRPGSLRCDAVSPPFEALAP